MNIVLGSLQKGPDDGYQVLVEQSAGEDSAISDHQYVTAGATSVPSEEQIF